MSSSAPKNERDEDADADAEEENIFATAYFPAPFVPLSAGAFVLPADSAAATASLRTAFSTTETPSEKKYRYQSKASLCPSFEDGTEEDGGDAPAPAGVGVVAATLAQMGFGSFGFSRFECFAVGRVARAVARAVSISGPPGESHAAQRQRHDNRPCALLLVDRVADLLTPALDEAFVGDDDDAFLAAAERVGARRVPSVFSPRDVNPSAFFARADATFFLRNAFLGKRTVAWAHPNDAEARRFADASTRRTLPQTAVAARRWVADAAREEGVVLAPSRKKKNFYADATRKNGEDAYENENKNANANANARVSASELRSMLEPFLDDPRVRLRRGAMTHAVAIVAECLENREDSLRARAKASAEASDASDSPAPPAARSFAAAVRDMTRDAARAVEARAGEGAAAAAVANSLRRTLDSATRAAKEFRVRSRREEDDRENETQKNDPPFLTLASAATLAVAAYALAGEAAAHERNALGLGPVDFSSLEEEASDEEFNSSDEEGLENKIKRVARDVARAASHASPFGRGDETLLRDALADFVFVVAASASFRTRAASEVSSDAEKEFELEKEERRRRAASLDWLGGDLAARLVEREARAPRVKSFSRDAEEASEASVADEEEEEEEEDFESRALLLETRDGVERFARRLGDVARARRRYASCGGLVDFAEASDARDRDRQHHRSLLKELAERVSVGADGGEGRRGETISQNAFVDAAHVASSLGGFLKSGVGAALGSFGLRGPTLVAAPKPSDSPTVLIFVLGGITAREIRDVRAAAADVVGKSLLAFSGAENGAKVEDILVGSTGLLRASGEDLVAMVA